jgi:hypothetical protein
MPKLGEAFVNIRANLKPLRAGLARARAAVTSAMKKIYGVIKRMAKYAALAFVALSGVLLKLAMDAQESENLFDVSMGKMAESTRHLA